MLPHDLIINERVSLHERSLLFSLLFDIASSSSLIKLTSEVSNVCFKGGGNERCLCFGSLGGKRLCAFCLIVCTNSVGRDRGGSAD